MNNNDKHQIIQNLNKMNRAAAISNEHFIVTNGTDEHLEEYFKFGNETLTIADNFDELCKEDIYQIMCACRKEEYAQILQGTENTQITAWWDKAADIIPLNCGKGNAVNAVLNYYGLSKDEAIAFGDGRNDIEMLEAVGTGVPWGMPLMKSKQEQMSYVNPLKKTECIITVWRKNSLNVDGLIIQQGCRVLYTLHPC